MSSPCVKIYTAAQMRAREQAAVAAGTPFLQLMENAGQAAAADLLRRCPEARRALIVCGKGNNGGDGLVMARVLPQHGWRVAVWLVLGEDLSDLAETNRRRLAGLPGVELMVGSSLPESLHTTDQDVVIDGIFGTGFSGALPASVAGCCRRMNEMRGLKVALDIPTGLNGDTAEADADTFRADLTYAFAACKPAHVHASGKNYCGEVCCLDIGID